MNYVEDLDVCSNACSFYITSSLRGLIETGAGEPILAEEGVATGSV